jgi:hypothetical protein
MSSGLVLVRTAKSLRFAQMSWPQTRHLEQVGPGPNAPFASRQPPPTYGLRESRRRMATYGTLLMLRSTPTHNAVFHHIRLSGLRAGSDG